MTNGVSTAIISLGSNLGNRLDNLIKAIALLARDPRVTLQKVSSLYRTAPVLSKAEVSPTLPSPRSREGKRSQPDFFNVVIQIRTSMTPRELMHCLQGIEKRLGRVSKGMNMPRTVDLDILEHGSSRMRESDLTLPHPRMGTRKFVLAPLKELYPRRRSVRNALWTKAVAAQRVQPVRSVKLRIKHVIARKRSARSNPVDLPDCFAFGSQ